MIICTTTSIGRLLGWRMLASKNCVAIIQAGWKCNKKMHTLSCSLDQFPARLAVWTWSCDRYVIVSSKATQSQLSIAKKWLELVQHCSSPNTLPSILKYCVMKKFKWIYRGISEDINVSPRYMREYGPSKLNKPTLLQINSYISTWWMSRWFYTNYIYYKWN